MAKRRSPKTIEILKGKGVSRKNISTAEFHCVIGRMTMVPSTYPFIQKITSPVDDLR